MPALPRSGEFALIDRHFRRPPVSRNATVGIGDDCALLAPLPNEQLAISTDMLVAGRHFFEDVLRRVFTSLKCYFLIFNIFPFV